MKYFQTFYITKPMGQNQAQLYMFSRVRQMVVPTV